MTMLCIILLNEDFHALLIWTFQLFTHCEPYGKFILPVQHFPEGYNSACNTATNKISKRKWIYDNCNQFRKNRKPPLLLTPSIKETFSLHRYQQQRWQNAEKGRCCQKAGIFYCNVGLMFLFQTKGALDKAAVGAVGSVPGEDHIRRPMNAFMIFSNTVAYTACIQ